ncbi:hypothetical protein AAFN47_06535 [Hoeflea sp. CAU 1731]
MSPSMQSLHNRWAALGGMAQKDFPLLVLSVMGTGMAGTGAQAPPEETSRWT